VLAATAWAEGGRDAGVKSTDAAARKAAVNRAAVLRNPAAATPTAASSTNDDATEVDPGVGPTPGQDKKGATAPEYKRPNRWSLTAGGSQRKDWLTGKNRWHINEHFNAKKVLGMPEWLNGSLEHRTRYETFDAPWRRGQM